jgi:hypothetical protein
MTAVVIACLVQAIFHQLSVSRRDHTRKPRP